MIESVKKAQQETSAALLGRALQLCRAKQVNYSSVLYFIFFFIKFYQLIGICSVCHNQKCFTKPHREYWVTLDKTLLELFMTDLIAHRKYISVAKYISFNVWHQTHLQILFVGVYRFVVKQWCLKATQRRWFARRWSKWTLIFSSWVVVASARSKGIIYVLH